MPLGQRLSYHIEKMIDPKKCKRSNTCLLMTKGCIEYYFMLHYEQTAPQIISPADKERVLNDLKKKHCTNYKKGDTASIYEIGRNYPTAVKNGIWSLKRLEDEVEDILIKNDERDRKLFITDQTFSNVHEGIEYLLKKRKKISLKFSRISGLLNWQSAYYHCMPA